jgi:hypothetical protein
MENNPTTDNQYNQDYETAPVYRLLNRQKKPRIKTILQIFAGTVIIAAAIGAPYLGKHLSQYQNNPKTLESISQVERIESIEISKTPQNTKTLESITQLNDSDSADIIDLSNPEDYPSQEVFRKITELQSNSYPKPNDYSVIFEDPKKPGKILNHLKQMHPPSLKNPMKDKIDELVKSHEKMYEFLSKNKVKKVYVENVNERTIQEMYFGKIGGFKYKFSAEDVKEGEEYSRDDLVKLGFVEGWLRLSYEGKIKILPLDRFENTHKKIGIIIRIKNKKTTFRDFEFTYITEENQRIEDVSKDPDEEIDIILGAQHNLTDNILEWNKKHPEDKFKRLNVYHLN